VLRTVQRAKEATEGVIAALKELKKSLMQHLFTYGPVPVTERERVALQETEIGPIPAHWRVVRLGEVLQLMRNGLTYRQERNHKGVPVTRIETISDGNINPNKVGYISSIDKGQIEKYRLLPGDILFSHINSEPHLGKTAIYQGNPPLILHGMNLLLLRAHPSVSDPYFLFYLLNHERAKGTFIGLAARAVGQSSINMGKLRNLSVPLPPLEEQREIARILQAVDAKIAAEQARRAALEELFKSLLHLLMTGKVRVKEDLGSQNANS
jgi:type I restriction enzyme S subunit